MEDLLLIRIFLYFISFQAAYICEFNLEDIFLTLTVTIYFLTSES